MEQSYIKNDLLTKGQSADLKELYDQYADKLLGYILAIVNNKALAEECLEKVFTTIYSSKNSLPLNSYGNTWNGLTAIAQQELKFSGVVSECKTVNENITYIQTHKYLNRMNDIQRLAFCGTYYHRKTAAELSRESGFTEQSLRLGLKEAFMIIRQVKDED